MLRAAALLLTALTGFSGLVYEVAWQKYLATLLGSQSESTAAVLGIFLGGLSVGYRLFGSVTRRLVAAAERTGRPPRLLLVYGALEASIGLYVLAFPWLFRGVQALSYSIPHAHPALGFALDVFLAALLIGPPSVLMGGTIPMLTQALSQSLEDATRFHAFVYAFNTFGAFVGAIAAGFYLIPQIGLEVTMLGMGFVNISAGLLFAFLGLRGRDVVSLEQPVAAAESSSGPGADIVRLFAAVAFLTGFAMMCLQTILNRIGVISFGSSQFTFSMVVAVFVLSIALGSFGVSAFQRIPKVAVVANQWGIALLFALLYSRIEEAPYWVHVIRTLFRDSNAGFFGFHFLALLLMVIVVGVPVMLSGAALPLLFHYTRRQVGHLGDLAGTLYSWNTVGSLLGALLGGYALLYWLDLHHIYRLAVGTLVLAAAILTVRVYSLRPLAYAALIPLLGALVMLPPWDTEILHAGLSRERNARRNLLSGARAYLQPYGGRFKPSTVLHSEDDPTTSVVVMDIKSPDGKRVRGLSTDGKGDGDTRGDYPTSGLLAMLPALFAEPAERAFVIGRGVGITAGELGRLDSMKHVEVVEISSAVTEVAHFFDFATLDASTNPKIHTTRSDAYRALMRSEGEFDVIVTAPSQLWVSGVEMLYSKEFLQAVRERLSPTGVYCQYLQRYETDAESLALVMRTVASVFEHTAVWHTSEQVLLVLGFRSDRFALDSYRLEARASRPDFRAGLERTGIHGFPELLAHEVLPLDVLGAAQLPGPIHSLYHPRLNDLAARAAFRGRHSDLPFTGFGRAAEVGAKNSLLRAYAARFGGRIPDETMEKVVHEACRTLGRGCVALLAEWKHRDPDSPMLGPLLEEYDRRKRPGISSEIVAGLTKLFASSAQETTSAVEATRLTDGFEAAYQHAAPFSSGALLGAWSACREGAGKEEACRALVGRDASETPGGGVGIGIEDEYSRCLQRSGLGQVCREGLERARLLLEHGRRSLDAE